MQLRRIVSDQSHRDAILISSPDLHSALPVWLDGPETAHAARIELALTKYFTRMSTRATPFGLVSGISVVPVGNESILSIEAAEAWQRSVSLDGGWLADICTRLAGLDELASEFLYSSNSTVYVVGEKVRYYFGTKKQAGIEYSVRMVDATPILLKVLSFATRRSPRELAGFVTEQDDEVDLDDASAFVSELVALQLLVPHVGPRLTGGDPLRHATASIGSNQAAQNVRHHLDAIQRNLDAIATATVPISEGHLIVDEAVRRFTGSESRRGVLHVDLVKTPTAKAQLAASLTKGVADAAEILLRLSPPRRFIPLETFAAALSRKYDTRRVPLLEALDTDFGVDFQVETSETGTRALDRRDILPMQGVQRNTASAALERAVFEAIASGHDVVRLRGEEISKDLALSSQPTVLATHVAVFGEFWSEEADRGNENLRAYVELVSQGLGLLGRFGRSDAITRATLAEAFEHEERISEQAIVAEVVHSSQGRQHNVLSREPHRRYEINLLAESSVSHDRQIAVADLQIAHRNGRLVLFSARLGKEVLPRLTTMHNFAVFGLPAYRFLCMLQYGGYGTSQLDLEFARHAPFLPRVEVNGVALTKAKWRLTETERAHILSSEALSDVVQRLREARRLPRLVALRDGESALTIDLSNPLSLDVLKAEVAKRHNIELSEVLPGCHWQRGATRERLVSEFVIPFRRSVREERQGPRATVGDRDARLTRLSPAVRSVLPGQRWLYLKLYCGSGLSDHVIARHALPLVKHLQREGLIRRWFFVRYADPDPHVRLRLECSKRGLAGTILSACTARNHALQKTGILWKVQVDTYAREIERYGGVYGMSIAESIFCIDSEATCSVLARLPQAQGSDARVVSAVGGVESMLRDMGLSRQGQLDFANAYLLQRSPNQRAAVVEAARGIQERLVSYFDQGGDLEWLPRSKGLSERLDALTRAAHRGRLTQTPELVLASLVHMHCNRLLLASGGGEESLVYNLLARRIRSLLAREGSMERPLRRQGASPTGRDT